jgi:ribosomal protein S18 acetylase RimI-like enzyme
VLLRYRPRVVPCFIVSYPVPAIAPVSQLDGSIWYKRVTSADDRHLAQVEPPWRLRQARHDFAHDEYALLAIDGDTTVGKLWLARRERGTNPFEGPHVRLAGDEEYIYGVWVNPEYRRSGIAVQLCLEVLEVIGLTEPPPHWVHFFVEADNAAIRKLVKRFFPGWESQEARLLKIGPAFNVKVPFSDRPRFGPLSSRGRHSGHGQQVPGKPADWYDPLHDLPMRPAQPISVHEPDPQPGGPDWVPPAGGHGASEQLDPVTGTSVVVDAEIDADAR